MVCHNLAVDMEPGRVEHRSDLKYTGEHWNDDDGGQPHDTTARA